MGVGSGGGGGSFSLQWVKPETGAYPAYKNLKLVLLYLYIFFLIRINQELEWFFNLFQKAWEILENRFYLINAPSLSVPSIFDEALDFQCYEATKTHRDDTCLFFFSFFLYIFSYALSDILSRRTLYNPGCRMKANK